MTFIQSPSKKANYQFSFSFGHARALDSSLGVHHSILHATHCQGLHVLHSELDSLEQISVDRGRSVTIDCWKISCDRWKE